MNKKVILVLVVFVLFIASIVSGKMYWNKKVANATGQTSEVTKKKAEVKDSGAKKEERKAEKSKMRSHLLMKHTLRIYQMK